MIPETVTVDVDFSQPLLAGSPDGVNDVIGTGDPLGREDFLLWEEDN